MSGGAYDPKMSQNSDIQRLPMDAEEFHVGEWTISYTKSHILHSQCNTADQCSKSPSQDHTCLFCKYTNTLELPHLPEMVFPNNMLVLKHSGGAQIEFNALDALKKVTNGKLPLKVACADVWKESRDPNHTEEKIKPFDWTFSTDYRGTITGALEICDTTERINIDKLREKEEILFYQELMLYEDELHDNGIASCTVKIRVMPSSFFVLLRYFLRVDNVMVRVNDTRVFHDFTKNYVLREYTNKEHGFRELGLPLRMFSDPNLISPHLPLRTGIYEKLTFSNSAAAEGQNQDQCAKSIAEDKNEESNNCFELTQGCSGEKIAAEKKEVEGKADNESEDKKDNDKSCSLEKQST